MFIPIRLYTFCITIIETNSTMNLKCLLVILCASTVNSQFYFARVIQGTSTTIERYPIMAQLLLDAWGNQQYTQHCAGVILTARHVISAAHCFQYNRNTGLDYSKPRYWKVRVGSSYRTRGGVIHNIKSIVRHPNFDIVYYNNDIAVIALASRINFNLSARQGTLIKQGVEVKPNSLCTILGWGVREVDGTQPDRLQQATLLTIDQKVCKQRFNTIGATIADSMMCAGKLDVIGPDGCFGDSGGPLVYKGLVVGLVSFGYSCGNAYYPGVYTKISHFTDWIVKTIFTST